MTAVKKVLSYQFLVFSLISILFTTLVILALPNSASAQVGGTGAEVIRPIERLWQLSRNTSYLLLTIVFMVIGLMVMLRARINPQTVVGLQQALPGIVIALVVITFSYFIASLIIDLAFLLSQAFGIVILVGLGIPVVNAQNLTRNILNNQNFFSLFLDALDPIILFNAANIIGGGIANALVSNIPLIGGLFNLFNLGTITGGAIAIIVLTVALLNAFFRLFFALVTAFVAIILNTIFGPFLILISALPGKDNNLSNWLRGLLANVLVFPVVFMVFVLVAVLLNRNTGFWVFGGATGSFNQPLPLFGGLPDDFIRFILAYGIILATPGIPDFIRQIISTPTPPQLGQSVEKATGAGQAGFGTIIGRIAKIPGI